MIERGAATLEVPVFLSDKPHDECGVYGVMSLNGAPSFEITKYAVIGAQTLRNRGGQGAGIATSGEDGVFTLRAGDGEIGQVLGERGGVELGPASLAVSHTLYSTGKHKAPHPMKAADTVGLLNGAVQHWVLDAAGAPRGDLTDMQRISALIEQRRVENPREPVDDSLAQIAPLIARGAYSMIVAGPDVRAGSGNVMVGLADPRRMKPFSIGRQNGLVAFTSETGALEATNFRHVRDFQPGEMVVASRDGLHVRHPFGEQDPAGRRCSFEWPYFAGADAVIDGISVMESRERLGIELAHQYVEGFGTEMPFDRVTDVPASASPALEPFMAQLRRLGVSSVEAVLGMEKIVDVRSYQLADDWQGAAYGKQRFIRSAFDGYRVLMLDDSIVRGSTGRGLVRAARESGALWVGVASLTPQISNTCEEGVVIDRDETIAYQMNGDEKRIAQAFDADHVGYLSLGRYVNTLRRLSRDAHERTGAPEINFCTHCMGGELVIPRSPLERAA